MLNLQQKAKLVEANTISAAFLCGAPRIQRLHKMLMKRPDAPDLSGRESIWTVDHNVVGIV